MIDVTVDDGKYRFIYDEKGKVCAFRHGEPWPAKEEALLGDKSHYALCCRIDELERLVPKSPEKEQAHAEQVLFGRYHTYKGKTYKVLEIRENERTQDELGDWVATVKYEAEGVPDLRFSRAITDFMNKFKPLK